MSNPNDANHWTSTLIGKTLVDGPAATHVSKSTLPNPHRIIKPGYMVTMDFNEARLNVHTDDSNKVTNVRYG
ncbi:hypothetical protein BCR44DRAFT_129004 [Catenaria anguillulae PL171]|uniref:Peptidase inhibitor I78 family-domain-containing protein n=1 Tax=Catenaria anguillulae PL171 TaxID=765915 RepID=A0A1Y2HES9_9FUNG|nr:hypothetical protein BCR44DRAFT_129004 [Catenaria anguillulae PL171]